MSKIFKSLLLIVAIIATSICASAKTTESTAVFNVSPKMVCANCENKIKSNIRFVKGVSNIETSIENETVTVTYNPEKTDTEKIAAAFQKIGYTATVATGSSATATQKSCLGCCKTQGSCCKAKTTADSCKIFNSKAPKVKDLNSKVKSKAKLSADSCKAIKGKVCNQTKVAADSCKAKVGGCCKSK
jgi:copper chaperone CopZ